jgi:hypothetical protein
MGPSGTGQNQTTSDREYPLRLLACKSNFTLVNTRSQDAPEKDDWPPADGNSASEMERSASHTGRMTQRQYNWKDRLNAV